MAIESFAVYGVDTDDLPGVTCRGAQDNYQIEVVIVDLGGWQIELLQHHRGECVYKDFMATRGEGVQHLGFFIKNADDYAGACDEMVRRGYAHVQGDPVVGKSRNVHFDYFDSTHALGWMVELLDTPELADELQQPG